MLKVSNPINAIDELCAKLQLSSVCCDEAKRQWLKYAKIKGDLFAISPLGQATSAVYLAGLLTGERRTQKEIAYKTGVSKNMVECNYARFSKIIKEPKLQ